MAKQNRTGMAIVSVSQLTGQDVKTDRNQKFPIVLTPIAGQIPSTGSVAVLSGSVADNMNLVPGRAALVTWVETDEAEFINRDGNLVKGPQFTWANAGTVSPMEVIQMKKELGAAGIVRIEDATPVEVKSEGNKTEKPAAGVNEKAGVQK